MRQAKKELIGMLVKTCPHCLRGLPVAPGHLHLPVAHVCLATEVPHRDSPRHLAEYDGVRQAENLRRLLDGGL